MKDLENPSPAGNKITISTQHITMPYPPPEILSAYEKACPGAADRIFRMAEKEQEHAHECHRIEQELAAKAISDQDKIIQYEYSLSTRGQKAGLIIGLAAMAVNVALAYIGNPYIGFCLSGPTIIVLVGSFLKKDPKDKLPAKEQDQKPKKLPENP